MTLSVRQIFRRIEEDCVDESIQELIRDMKATQHGDRVNPFYELMKDYHKEGGVWKHTVIALEALPVLSKALTKEFNDQEYTLLYDAYKNELRSAALYHDIGKLVTQTPSKTRPGSYSFPGHQEGKVVAEVAEQYGISLSPMVKGLIAHHHDSPEQASKLPVESLKLLIILKAVDNIAVGPRTEAEAIDHIRPFVATATV